MIIVPGGDDIRDVEQRAHGLIAVAEVREPDGGDWHPMLVQSGSVTLTELGALPARTAELSVMSWTDDTDDVGDWLRRAPRFRHISLQNASLSRHMAFRFDLVPSE